MKILTHAFYETLEDELNKSLVSLDENYRKTDDKIELMGWKKFCRDLWAGSIIV